MSEIRLIVSDLDGTLLSPSQQLSPQLIAAIQRYQSQGGWFSLATGRPYITAMPIARQLGIQLPLILCNGAVMATAGGAIVEKNGLDAGLLSGLLHEANEAGLNILFYRGDQIYTFRHTADIADYEHKECVTCSVISYEEEIVWRDCELDKVILLGPVETSYSLWMKWAPALADAVAVFQSEYNYLELVAGHVSKGTALKLLMQKLEVRPEEVMAVGNQMNDLPMLLAAGIGVAVANSPDKLKEIADYVCVNSYGDGVLEAIELFIYSSWAKARI